MVGCWVTGRSGISHSDLTEDVAAGWDLGKPLRNEGHWKIPGEQSAGKPGEDTVSPSYPSHSPLPHSAKASGTSQGLFPPLPVLETSPRVTMLAESLCNLSHSCTIQCSPPEACMAQYGAGQSQDMYSPVQPCTAHYGPVKSHTAQYGSEQPGMVQCSPIWPSTALYIPLWLNTFLYGPVPHYTDVCGVVQSCVAKHRPVQTFTAPHGLVNGTGPHPRMAQGNQVQPHTAQYGLVQSCTAPYGQVQLSISL